MSFSASPEWLCQKTSNFFLELWGNQLGWWGQCREAEFMVGEMVLGTFIVFALQFLSNGESNLKIFRC